MKRLEVNGAVRPLYGSLGVRGLKLEVEQTMTSLWERIMAGEPPWKWTILNTQK